VIELARKSVRERYEEPKKPSTYERIVGEMTDVYREGIAKRLHIKPEQVKTDLARRWAKSWIGAFVDVSKLDERPILNLVFSTIENMRARIQKRRAQIRQFIGSRRHTTSDEESYIVDEFAEYEEEEGEEYE